MRLRHVIGLAAVLLVSVSALAQSGRTVTLTDEQLYDRVYGGWLGQAIGVALGAPWEFRVPWPAPEITYYEPNARTCVDQDDLYIEIVSLIALEKAGPRFTCRDIGALWPEYLRPEVIWAANRAAYENMMVGIEPPDSGHPAWNDSWDAIDAQIEADLFGLVSPAMVNVAAEAGLEASHVTNWGRGSYAAAFISACYASAFVEKDVDGVVRSALATIPPDSDYAQMVRLIRSWRRAGLTWQEARERLSRVYEPQNVPISAMINSGAVLIGLLWGNNDFGNTICIATMCGWDSDCNPASAGGIVGCMLGASALPAEWKDPIGDTYYNKWALPKLGRETIPLSEFAQRTDRVAKEFLAAHGAVETTVDGAKAWRIPLEAPRAIPVEEATPEQIAQWRLERYRKLAERFRPGWTLSDCGPDMAPGIRADYLGREHVLVTHPLDRETSAKLTCTVRRTGGPATLRLTVTSYDGDARDADWVLRVRAGDELLLEKTIGRIDGKPTWQTFEVDLSDALAKSPEATLMVENAPSGWSFEAGYVAELDVTGAEVVTR